MSVWKQSSMARTYVKPLKTLNVKIPKDHSSATVCLGMRKLMKHVYVSISHYNIFIILYLVATNNIIMLYIGVEIEVPPPPPPVVTPASGTENSINYTAPNLTPDIVHTQ